MTPWTGRLLLANVVVFVVTTFGAPQLLGELSLVPAALPSRPWTAITYMFLHAGIWHLGFNMLALFFFGPRLEARLGGRQFLALYFLSGLAAAALSWAFTPEARIVGASGAVFGVLLGFARYWPRERILIWGVLPIEARWLVVITTALALYGGISGSQSGIAHFAHLGGFLGGWVFLAVRDRRDGRAGMVQRIIEEKKADLAVGRRRMREWERIDPEGLHEVNRENLERIRRKIDEDGPGSLTRKEREFMNRLVERSE